MRKGLIKIKAISIFSCLILLMILSVLNSINKISSTSYFINAVFTALSGGIALTMFVLYKKECKKCEAEAFSLLWLIISVLSYCGIYCIYCIPLLGFIDVKGVNNSVIIVYTFSLFSMFIYDLSYYIDLNHNNSPRKIGCNKSDLSSLCKVARAIAVYFIVVAIIVAIINFVMPKIDVSIPYQVLIENKSFSEALK